MSLSMLAAYYRERQGLEVLETEWGFCAWQYKPELSAAYIVEIYVIPDCRKDGVARAMADCVAVEARERGCGWLYGSVAPAARGATASLKVLLAYGMEVCGIDHQQGLVMFRKELDNGR